MTQENDEGRSNYASHHNAGNGSIRQWGCAGDERRPRDQERRHVRASLKPRKIRLKVKSIEAGWSV